MVHSDRLWRFSIGVILFIWAGCELFFPERLLEGQWQATVVLEEGDTLPVDVGQIRLIFDDEGHYRYHSTLNYREAGFYKLEGALLYTRDTTHRDTVLERFVKVPVLTTDSMVVLMRTREDKERLLRFRRIPDSPSSDH